MKILRGFFRLVLLLILIIFLLAISVSYFLFRDYKQWEADFEGKHLSTDYITLEDTNIKESLDKKIEAFGKSPKNTDFIELSDKEVLYLLGESLNESIPLNSSFERGYVESEKGKWDIYIQAKILDKYTTPWILVVLEKDNVESPEVYASTILIGNYDFNDYFLGSVVRRVNLGISEAISLVNSSDFTGRTFKNIELEKGIMTIKGEL